MSRQEYEKLIKFHKNAFQVYNLSKNIYSNFLQENLQWSSILHQKAVYPELLYGNRTFFYLTPFAEISKFEIMNSIKIPKVIIKLSNKSILPFKDENTEFTNYITWLRELHHSFISHCANHVNSYYFLEKDITYSSIKKKFKSFISSSDLQTIDISFISENIDNLNLYFHGKRYSFNDLKIKEGDIISLQVRIQAVLKMNILYLSNVIKDVIFLRHPY